jgi:hypothetical protein
MTTHQRRTSGRTSNRTDLLDITSVNIEPSRAELAAIENEWPLIEAELLLLDAEIRNLIAGHHVSELDVRRVRRAEDRVTREAATFASRAAKPSGRGRAA